MTFDVRTLGDYEDKVSEQRWIWRNRIPLGKVTLISGDWGAGKTHSVANIITTLLKQEDFADGEVPGEDPGEILIVTTESEIDELVKIFKAQGCTREELDRIHVMGFVVEPDKSDHKLRKFMFDLDRHLLLLEAEILKWKPIIIVIDPLVQFHNRKEIDSHAIRGLMMLLDDLCQRHQVSILAMIHWNKNEKLASRNRTSGSHQYSAGVKSVIIIERNSKNPTLRLFIQDKMNLGPEPISLAFTIDSPDGLVIWQTVENVEPPTKVSEAKQWLLDNLGESAVAVQEVYTLSGFNDRTMRRARSILGALIVTTERYISHKYVSHWEMIGPHNNWGAGKISTNSPSGHDGIKPKTPPVD